MSEGKVQRYTRIANAPFLSLRCQFLINRQGNSWPALRDLLYLYQGILRPDLDMTVFRICPFLISYWHRCDNLRRLTRWSGNDPIQYVDRRVEPLRNSWTQLNRITRRGKLTCSDDVQRCRRTGRSVMPSFPCRTTALCLFFRCAHRRPLQERESETTRGKRRDNTTFLSPYCRFLTQRRYVANTQHGCRRARPSLTFQNSIPWRFKQIAATLNIPLKRPSPAPQRGLFSYRFQE
jgi:hypothetical protein